MADSIASRWRKLSGEENWEGLLQPLDSDLRKYLIHYAQMTGAVADLLDSDTGEPQASKENFFFDACLEKGNPYKYEVTHFLYGTSNIVNPSWFGYVAVATDEGKRVLGRRDIVVAWRGTSSSIWEWINDFNIIIQREASDIFPTAKQHDATVHMGFHDLYTGTNSDSPRTKTSAKEQVLDAIKELVNKYKDEEISITVSGFSLGAALAVLTAMDIVAHGYNKPTTGNSDKSVMVTTFTFGGPCIGNTGLANLFDSLRDHLRLLRVVNHMDPVPTSLSEVLDLPYTEFGIQLMVNTHNSHYLKSKLLGTYAAFPHEHEEEFKVEHESKFKGTNFGVIEDFFSCHNMDIYAHGVAIKDIGGKIPVEKLDHDLVLVNKYLDRVSNEYKIPSEWWAGDSRKGMSQLDNGRWEFHPVFGYIFAPV